MTLPILYEIVETRYQPKEKTTLDFKGTFEEAKEKALEKARRKIGVRFDTLSFVRAVAWQNFRRTTGRP